MKYYLVGIKGTGMCALAIYLKKKGCQVFGSDTTNKYFTDQQLAKHSLLVKPFSKDNITGEHLYIISNAYNKYNNDEVRKIMKYNYKYYYYHEFIAKFCKQTICVSGTHGKTTTTTFIASMLDDKCSYIIGDGSGNYYNNDLMILEACEYKNHFLFYHPKLLIITNIELDHPDYFKNKSSLFKSFKLMAKHSEQVLVNGDLIKKKIKHPHLITFGFKRNNDYRIKIIKKHQSGYDVLIIHHHQKDYLHIPYLGKHMIYNYVSASIALYILKLNPHYQNVRLPKRRFEIHKLNHALLISDYAHHPTEIKALYKALRLSYPNKKLIAIFQSHTYERTIKYRKAFKCILRKFDDCYMLDCFFSKRGSYNEPLQKYLDGYFNCFKKYQGMDIIKDLEEVVYIFIGAGISSNIMDNALNKYYLKKIPK